MKKILLLAFTILSISSAFAQSQRTIFVEEFTQASCPPCEVSTPILNATLEANADKLVQLRYQTSWPGVDPMNEDNPVEVRARVDYYEVNGVPSAFVDGASPVGVDLPELVTQSTLDNAYAQEAPVVMTVEHTLSDNLNSVEITVTVTNEGDAPYNVATNRLRVALVEEKITWDTPPGSTSITVFDAVMKAFVTGTEGMMLPEIAAGETWTNTWNVSTSFVPVYNYREMAVVAFIQNDANRSVQQAAHSKPQELTGDYKDAEIISTTNLEGDYCNYSFVGTAQVTNVESSDDIAGFAVDMFVNGVLSQTLMVEESLAAGETMDLTFDESTLNAGPNFVGYVVRLNEGDLSTKNNITPTTFIGKATGNIAESIDITYEDEAIDPFTPVAGTIIKAPGNLLYFTVINSAVFGLGNSIGAYGESENLLSVDLWTWNPGPTVDAEGFMVIDDQYVVPEDAVELTFDYAYTSYGGSNDRLIVEVSDNCGITFTEVFNQAGAQLRTAPEVNGNTRFIPNANQWRTVEADLSDFAGETIMVRFRVISAWGDMLYFDNIALRVITDVNELEANESLRVYPNPASAYVNVELTTPNASKVNLRVIDMLGRTIKSENLGTVSGMINHTLDVSSITNGSYLLLMNVDGRDVVKRLSIAN
ncbi:MAG: Omp28-related outer membrane protein [Bacteroidota bacterium]